jgi:predicted DNA binding CopG/RHH family protein
MIEDLIASEAEASERNQDAPIRPGTKLTRGHGRSRTLQVRLNEEELQTIAALAEQRGVPASTLARDLLLTHLSGDADTPQSVLARMRADLDILTATVA